MGQRMLIGQQQLSVINSARGKNSVARLQEVSQEEMFFCLFVLKLRHIKEYNIVMSPV